MSNCSNPDCPIHGTSPRATIYRETRQRIVTNVELMDVIRVLAVNTDTHIVQTADEDPNHPMYIQAHLNILIGNDDEHPLVQGLINGFVMLLQGNRPTQEFFATCQNVPEEKTYLADQRARWTHVASEPPPFQVFSFGSAEDLLSFLSRGGRGG